MSRRALTDAQVIQAREMRLGRKLSYQKIADAFEVSYSSMRLSLNPGLRIAENERAKKHREDSPEYLPSWRKKHQGYGALAKRRWRKNYPEKHAAYQAARRAMILGATIGNLAEIREIYSRAKKDPKVRCYLCGKLIPLGHRHVDHIVPLSKGGAHRSSNLAVACDICNDSKGAKPPNEVGVLL